MAQYYSQGSFYYIQVFYFLINREGRANAPPMVLMPRWSR